MPRLVTFLLLVLTIRGTAQEAAFELYVSPGGDDLGSGRSVDGPFRTLGRARDEIRSRALSSTEMAARGFVVHLAAGTYRERLELGAEDSGTPEAPIRWQGAGAQATILTVGIPLTDWRPWRGRILSCALEGKRPTQVFCAGERQDRARFPNRDHSDRHGGAWAHVAAVDSQNEFTQFHYGSGESHVWVHPEDASIAIFSGFDWAFRMLPLASCDTSTRTMTIGAKTWFPMRAGDRYLIEGVLEELDSEGEWCVDARADTVYWWPPNGVDPKLAEAGASGLVVQMRDATGIIVSDLSIAGCDGDAVRIEGGRCCTIERCTIGSCGKTGVVIAGGSGHAIRACSVSGTGEGGISAAGGDRKAITSGSGGFTSAGGHRIEDNDVHDCAQVWRTYRPGISISGVGNIVVHNHVHDLPHAGITFTGNEHIIEFNHVHHVNREAADSGGLYFCSRDWAQRGSIIRFNYFHHCGGYGKTNAWQPVTDGVVEFRYPAFTWGVYLDDPSCGTQVIGNIFDRVPVCAMHNHGGSDNVWANNIVIDCPAINVGTLDPKWDQWPKLVESFHSLVRGSPDFLERYPDLMRIDPTEPERVSGVRFERNIVVFTAAGTAWIRGQHPEWKGTLPLYSVRLRDDDLVANTWDHNCLFAEPGVDARVQRTRIIAGKAGTTEFLTWEAWKAMGQDANSQWSDPGFSDLEKRDLSLPSESPAIALGFEPIPFAQIGPRTRPFSFSESQGPHDHDADQEAVVQRFEVATGMAK